MKSGLFFIGKFTNTLRMKPRLICSWQRPKGGRLRTQGIIQNHQDKAIVFNSLNPDINEKWHLFCPIGPPLLTERFSIVIRWHCHKMILKEQSALSTYEAVIHVFNVLTVVMDPISMRRNVALQEMIFTWLVKTYRAPCVAPRKLLHDPRSHSLRDLVVVWLGVITFQGSYIQD